MQDIETFKEKLKSLISKFEKDKHHYLSKGYLEAQLRIDFLNPFFEALGWDIENKAHKPPHDRDVIVELSPEATGRPDYNFRINGATKFFVEAKSPSVALDDVNHILQAKTYAWSTKEVYFVILTDFEEFKLFDASLKPNSRYPNEGLIFDFKYTDYLKNIDKLYNLSKEEVEKGSLEKLLPRDVKSKRLRIPVDKAFLEDMTAWREELAKDIYKRNPPSPPFDKGGLGGFEINLLNEVVQKLLDRVVFIRIAEDRKIRDANELKDIVELWRHEGKRKPILNHLKDLFYEVNDDLNGDIFKPHACESIDVDSNLLADIIENLYFPKCRYRFDVIGVELLGSIYERYLGSTIRVTPQRIKVEEKPEVRKAGGVYYTPKYIVEYIVKNTVGKLIEGKTPKQIEKIKILDPACGSGSFLLGAYQYLIDYHLKYYREHPKEAQHLKSLPLLYYKQLPEDITLPLHEKAKILRNNIFGVDIDPQAVEITMMSLYLKALEGERGLLPKKQHLLPSLTNNIKCGNSLIGYDIFEDSPLLRGVRGVFSPLTEEGEGEFSDETKSRINPFDWNSKTAGFGEIMNPSQSPLDKGGSKGGFDCVIGNPPYVRIQMLPKEQVDYFNRKYKSATGNYDIYALFVEKALHLLKESGIHGYIMPHKFFQASYGEGLRKLIAESRTLTEIVNFRDNQIFEGASTYTCLLFIEKIKNNTFKFADVARLKNPVAQLQIILKTESYKDDDMQVGMISKKEVTVNSWNFSIGERANLTKKISRTKTCLKDVCTRIYQGVITSADPIFLFKDYEYGKSKARVFSKALNENIQIETAILRKVIRSGDIGRYFAEPKALVLFPYKIADDYAVLYTHKELEELFPLALTYLKENKRTLEAREGGKFKGQDWYRFGRSQNIAMWERPKILVPYMITRLSAYMDENEHYYFVNVTTGGYGLIVNENIISTRYLTALLNSKLLDFYLKQITTNFRGGYFAANKQYIEKLPIRTIDFNNPAEKATHDKLVSLVDRILELHKKKNSLPPSAEREKIEREIAVTDEKIDEIVYGLYGITEEDRKVIEGGKW